jgi:hypothetical protein
MTERQFIDNLRKMGYQVKFGQDITLRPEGKSRGLKLKRNFGDDYSIEGIRHRILAQTRPERQIIMPDPPTKKVRFIGNIHTPVRMTGLRARYFYYLYRLGVLPKKREPNPKRVYFLFREDIRFIQNISAGTRLLVMRRIDTTEQLSHYKEKLISQINNRNSQRKELRKKARSVRDEDTLVALKAEIAALSKQMGELRKEVRLCEDIEKRSGEMREKIRKEAEVKKILGKGPKKHEPFRGRR